ncbi:phosphatase PAP2 family protein [uncultured Thiodictyon sp.]|uniref:phosphatase PAP2 family protein n=1 Tax=uncultured Thiodictyon sp. TaxID=1846217 RepID=UPI0025EC0A37|nr:phosphatase PAP2 family protein [uncultured Thiodictyon sp.]
MQTPTHSSRYWLPQLLALGLLALIGTLPFWLSDLDLRAAASFYHPAAPDPWWESGKGLWVFFYQASPLLSGLILLGSLLAIGAGMVWPYWRRRRWSAIFVLAATLLGPGLVINGVFKDYWGRPRPHQTLDLGGTHAYVPPLARTPEFQGKSFPSGHSSVGFALGAFALIWQRRRPRLALATLIVSAVLGTLLGLGRMTAGDHFLSDVIWSAVMTYAMAFVLYWLILRLPQRDNAARAPLRRLRYPGWSAAAYVLATALLLFGVLLATPVQETRNLSIQALPATGPRTLRLVADTATLILFPLGPTGEAVSIRLKGRGFGLPTNRVRGRLERTESTLTYTVTHTGVFTERDSSLTVGIEPRAWKRIEMVTKTGDIRVLPLGQPLPQLDLKTGNGVVLDENRPPDTPR